MCHITLYQISVAQSCCKKFSNSAQLITILYIWMHYGRIQAQMSTHTNIGLIFDNMSYEELLALKERIGNVNTGLTEENISKCMKQKIYVTEDG
nr:hypothetical protein [Tanacetum cinerariifolium]